MEIKTHASPTILSIWMMWKIEWFINTGSTLIFCIICNKTWELRYINSDLIDVSVLFQKSVSRILN